MSTKTESRRGVGFLQLLTLLFIGLKLGGVITWSWWWVLSPLWIPLAIAVVIMLGIGLFAGVATLTVYVLERKQRKARTARLRQRRLR